MILVTVGTHNHGFNRLVQAMDDLAANFDEQVIIQRGSSTYDPQYAEHFELTSYEHIQQLTEQARVVVAHAAAGAILVTLGKKKPLVVLPRLQRFGECIDDHQLELAEALSAQGQAVVVNEPSASTLHLAIEKAVKQQVDVNRSQELIGALREEIRFFERLPHRRAPFFFKVGLLLGLLGGWLACRRLLLRILQKERGKQCESA